MRHNSITYLSIFPMGVYAKLVSIRNFIKKAQRGTTQVHKMYTWDIPTLQEKVKAQEKVPTLQVKVEAQEKVKISRFFLYDNLYQPPFRFHKMKHPKKDYDKMTLPPWHLCVCVYIYIYSTQNMEDSCL